MWPFKKEREVKENVTVPSSIRYLLERGVIFDSIKVTEKLGNEMIVNRREIDKVGISDKLLDMNAEFDCFCFLDKFSMGQLKTKSPDFIGKMYGKDVIIEEAKTDG